VAAAVHAGLHPAERGVDIREYHSGGCSKRVQHLFSGYRVLVVWPAAVDWPDFGDAVQLLQPERVLVVKISAQRGQILGGEFDFADSGERVSQGFTTLYQA
jgi:hypothetical protein